MPILFQYAFVLVAALVHAAALATGQAAPIEFSVAEKDYIQKAGSVTLCVDPDWAPFERVNAQGQHEGIAADLIALVAQRTGLHIAILPTSSWDESIAASKSKRCKIMSFLNQTPERDAWLAFTAPLFSDTNVIITREEHGFIPDLKALQNQSIALPRGTMVEERIRKDFPQLTVVLTENESQAMQLVSDRTADMTVRSLIVAAHAIKKEGLFNLKISGQIPEYTNQLRMGVLKDEPVLQAILDKGVKTITAQERDTIANKHVAIYVQQGIDWTRVYILLALLAAALLLAGYIYRNNRRLQWALTASQEARNALHISEERHRVLADNASDVIWTLDSTGQMTYISPSVERLRGYTPAEALQQTLEQALTPASAAIAKAGIERILQAANTNLQPMPDFRAELEQPCKNGGTVWTEVSVAGIRNAAGQGVGLLGVSRDITRRMQADLDLRIAAIAFESQDGMIVTDVNSTILRVNRAFTRITGYTTEESIGQTPRILQSGRHDAHFYADLWATVQRTGFWHGEIWNKRKNGEIFPEQLTITAVKGNDGQVTHYVATLHDITHRKQLEKEVERLAFFDPLTQLPNRRLFNDRFGQTLARAKRNQSRMALLFIDLDKFKPINDTHGHEAGDQVLIELAKRIEGCLRASDSAARVGGDEFLVLLSELQSVSDALVIAEKIRSALVLPCITPSQVELPVSASIGIALYPEHGQTEQDLLREGDLAMYQSKSAGGNAVTMAAAQ